MAVVAAVAKAVVAPISWTARIRVRLVDDWRNAWKWGTLRFGAFTVAVGVAADHWGEASPFIMRFFPHADQTVAPFVGVVLIMLFRVLHVYVKDRDDE